MSMNHGYAHEKLTSLLRDLDHYNAGEFWRQMSRIAEGSTGMSHAEAWADCAKRLNAKLEDIQASLCGQGFEVSGWHLNGDLEPIDTWFTDNDWEPEPLDDHIDGAPGCIRESKYVWVAWTNTDLTEGRGQSVPLAVCDAEATARRMGKRGSVQGSDCYVTKETAYRIDSHHWLAPCRIHSPTAADAQEEKRLEAERQSRKRKEEALKRAKAAGMSDDDIRALGGDL